MGGAPSCKDCLSFNGIGLGLHSVTSALPQNGQGYNYYGPPAPRGRAERRDCAQGEPKDGGEAHK